MSQLLSGKHKGRFGAPPDPADVRSPWRAVPLYLPVPMTAVFFVVAGTSWLAYNSCGTADSEYCLNAGALRVVETGSLGGILGITGSALGLALVLVVVATVRVRKGPLWMVYLFAVVALALVIYAFLVLNGSMATPLGGLGEIPRHSSAGG